MDFGKDCNLGFDDSFMFWSFVWSVKERVFRKYRRGHRHLDRIWCDRNGQRHVEHVY